LILSASHTHNGPSFEPPPEGVRADFSQAYIDGIAEKMVNAVLQADQARVEATMGWGAGDGRALLFNRRPKKADGTVVMSFEPPEPEIAKDLEFGPVDPDIGVLAIDDVGGQPVATLLNFGAHNVCTQNNLYSVSADYAGYAMATVEEENGGICLFSLGAAGNVVPIERGEVARERIGRAVGQEASRVRGMITSSTPSRLGVRATSVDLPARPVPPVEVVKGMMEQAQKELAEGNQMAQFKIMQASFMLRLLEELGGRATLPADLKLVQIGDLNLVSMPGEQFAETGLAIKKRIPHTLVISLADAYLGYVPTAAAYDEPGGFEQNITKLAQGSAEQMAAGVYALAEQNA
jgi:hypothetical protein